MAIKTIEERVAFIEKVFWVVGIVAVIFGVSGAWGYNLLQKSIDRLDGLDNTSEHFSSIRSAEEDIFKEFFSEQKRTFAEIKEYRLSISGAKTENIFTNQHAFCSVSGLEFNKGAGNGNKLCITKKQDNGTWIVESTAEKDQNLVCTVACI